jgi:glycosyltransferase involved in cell wall biosynthesis
VITIHDLIVDHFETGQASTLPMWKYKLKHLGYRWILKTALRRCQSILTISKTTKVEIMDHYHIPDSKITVTYDALDKSFKYAYDHRKNTTGNKLPANYLLYVGNAYPHKNLEAFLDALKLINKKTVMHAVLAGDDHFFYPRLMEYSRKIGVSNRIVFWGDADDSSLVSLYTNARLLIFPSLMEGYGLPVVEAVYCGLMPVVSDIPVFHELWGDDVNYFNPNDRVQMAKIITQSLSMPKSEYNVRIGKLKKAISRYQWDQTARQTLQIYQTVARISRK